MDPEWRCSTEYSTVFHMSHVAILDSDLLVDQTVTCWLMVKIMDFKEVAVIGRDKRSPLTWRRPTAVENPPRSGELASWWNTLLSQWLNGLNFLGDY